MFRSVAIGLVGVVTVILAVVLIFWRDVDEEKLLKEQRQAPTSAAVPQRKYKTNPKETIPTTVNETDAKAKPLNSVLPSFDVVRVNQAGDAVIAGRAAPGAQITIFDGENPVGKVTVDRNGEWVLIPEKPLLSGNRVLSIVAEMPGGERLRSEDLVVLAVPEITRKQKTPFAVLVPREGKETKKILQRSGPQNPSSRTIELTLDIVDYDEEGRLRLLGQAHPGNLANVYLNNASIGQSRVKADGSWELRPEAPVAPGLYTLRVDELQVTKVVARIELPFSRAAPIDELQQTDYIIVQPGNSLWRISRRILGQGTMYSVIYEANKDQIRDANLIYPGQVFAVPRTN